MSLAFNFFQLSGGGSIFGLIIGALFFLMLAAAAFVTFKALAKTVKFAVRGAIVVIILMVALVGGVSLWYFSAYSAPQTESAPAKKPTKSRSK